MKALVLAGPLAVASSFALVARAQSESALAPVTIAPTPRPSDAEAVDMTRFCHRFSVGRSRFYPPRALEQSISGAAILDCVVDADGNLRTCQVVDEQPRNYAFGDAALRGACQMRPIPMTPARDAVIYTPPGSEDRHIRWVTRFSTNG